MSAKYRQYLTKHLIKRAKEWLHQIFMDLCFNGTYASSFYGIWSKLSFPNEYCLCNDYFIIMTTLIADFSSVLLDVRDRSILSTKPISAKTINAAKFMHIFIYLTYLTIAFTAIPLWWAYIIKGLYSLF